MDEIGGLWTLAFGPALVIYKIGHVSDTMLLKFTLRIWLTGNLVWISSPISQNDIRERVVCFQLRESFVFVLTRHVYA